MEIVNEMKKLIGSKKHWILWLACQKEKIFETFNANEKFINLVNNFGTSRLTMAFEISIV